MAILDAQVDGRVAGRVLHLNIETYAPGIAWHHQRTLHWLALGVDVVVGVEGVTRRLLVPLRVTMLLLSQCGQSGVHERLSARAHRIVDAVVAGRVDQREVKISLQWTK